MRQGMRYKASEWQTPADQLGDRVTMRYVSRRRLAWKRWGQTSLRLRSKQLRSMYTKKILMIHVRTSSIECQIFQGVRSQCEHQVRDVEFLHNERGAVRRGLRLHVSRTYRSECAHRLTGTDFSLQFHPLDELNGVSRWLGL